MAKRLWFGPAGKPISMKKGKMEDVPAFLRSIGLDALEYEAVRGVRISEAKARLLGERAKENSVVLSLHAPYYINLASKDNDKREASIRRIIDSMKAAEWMGAYAVVIHTGYYKGYHDKREALEAAIKGYEEALNRLPAWVKKPDLSPEVMGRKQAIGDIDEVIEICRRLGRRCRPTIDWAHLYARYEGKFVTSVDHVISVIEKFERELGTRAVRPLHTHFSKIEYGPGGEREHHTLSEEEYGPEWDIVCKAYLETGVHAVIISESPILEEDAILMRDHCKRLDASAV
ncbi:MAG: TIM barrel protein [Desulfurococcales archaeon]|nr:TIM barrel protein [Desulfurococcales archaeon]